MMVICSGVYFSHERFPAAAEPFIRGLPLTILNDACRPAMDAAPLANVATHTAALTAWGVVSFAIGLKIFPWQ